MTCFGLWWNHFVLRVSLHCSRFAWFHLLWRICLLCVCDIVWSRIQRQGSFWENEWKSMVNVNFYIHTLNYFWSEILYILLSCSFSSFSSTFNTFFTSFMTVSENHIKSHSTCLITFFIKLKFSIHVFAWQTFYTLCHHTIYFNYFVRTES